MQKVSVFVLNTVFKVWVEEEEPLAALMFIAYINLMALILILEDCHAYKSLLRESSIIVKYIYVYTHTHTHTHTK